MATYYIDPVNGTDTFTGTRIDSTVDSTADTTHFVDNALTGADDYLNGSFFYNVTRGIGSLITDFVAADDTVTLADAIAGMTAGDTYYILNAWQDLDQFTENARSAGDKVVIRRGANQCDDGSDLNFTSDGTIVAPITIEADYDNLWRDQVDLSATGTATLTFGSKTVTFSADVSGVLAAGDWIYASGENNREFAYEVASVSTTTVTLYLPYKGDQAGSGRTMYNMQDNPIWNSAAGDFQWLFSGDQHWNVQGLHVRGTDANGNIQLIASKTAIFKDVICEGNGASDLGFNASSNANETGIYVIRKCRTYNHVRAISNLTVDGFNRIYVYNSLLNCNSVTNAVSYLGTWNTAYFYETECSNATTGIDASTSGLSVQGRNILFSSVTTPVQIEGAVGTFDTLNVVGIEDYNNAPGDSRYYSFLSSADNTALFQSETTTVRSGGSNKSVKVTPSTVLSTLNDNASRVQVFELPIYTTTDSKTYTVYFKTNDIADWTADPTASELWIELEAWGHATNNFRKITKSTGTIDFNGSTAWQSLSVTVAPAQAGVAYLRCWYCKTKEASSNVFYVDPLPVIS